MGGTLAKSKNVCATPRNFQPSALLFDFKGYWISLRDKIILVEQISVSNVPQPFDPFFWGGWETLAGLQGCQEHHTPMKDVQLLTCPTLQIPKNFIVNVGSFTPGVWTHEAFKSMGLEGC